MTELRLAAGLHLADGDAKGVGPEAERPAQSNPAAIAALVSSSPNVEKNGG
jgi:hypothetical protein